ncbi:MAG: response regulator [Bacteroidia bacterium]|nr:response regulator [Bacteroidia bacterium]MCZ2249643.1 response regulator [Bacteroidia bacterium]
MNNNLKDIFSNSTTRKYNISVLMVEDDFINIFMMQKVFDTLFDVTYARSSSEAYGFLENNTFDLVLMDINLGEETVDGVDILRSIRLDTRHTNTRVFAVTGYVLEGDREKYLEIGFDEHFPKPLTKDLLTTAIEKYFQ